MIFEVLHETTICRTSSVPKERTGQPTNHKRAVVCADCGLDGILASYGYEDQVRQEWADQNKVTVRSFLGEYVLQKWI